jgi:hypothetical protein
VELGKNKKDKRATSFKISATALYSFTMECAIKELNHDILVCPCSSLNKLAPYKCCQLRSNETMT